MDTMPILDPRDLDMLLAVAPEEVLGCIIRLNKGARYHNRINAIALAASLAEMRRQRENDRATGPKTP